MRICQATTVIEKVHQTLLVTNLPLFSAIITPIFSNVASCNSHAGSESVMCICNHIVNRFETGLLYIPVHPAARQTSSSIRLIYWYTVVLRLPVGMLIISQKSAGSTQSVPGTFTTHGESTKLVSISRPPKMAPGGTLIAFAT